MKRIRDWLLSYKFPGFITIIFVLKAFHYLLVPETNVSACKCMEIMSSKITLSLIKIQYRNGCFKKYEDVAAASIICKPSNANKGKVSVRSSQLKLGDKVKGRKITAHLPKRWNIKDGVDTLIIGEGVLSIFNVGETIPLQENLSLLTIEKTTEWRYGEGDEWEQDVYYIMLGSDTILQLENSNYKKNIIKEIKILSNKIRTKEGIGIESTAKEFATTYNDYSIWSSYLFAEDLLVIDTKQYGGMNFMLNTEGLDLTDAWIKSEYPGDMSKLKSVDYVKDVKIESIRIFR